MVAQINFLFHKRLFVAKEGSSDYKKGFALTERFFVEPHTVRLHGIAVKNPLSTFIFKRRLFSCAQLLSGLH